MKKIALCLCFILLFSVVSLATPSRLVDNADLLSESEKTKLLEELDEASEKLEYDIVIVTVDTLGGKTLKQYAEDFFDYNGYGYGETYDGVILLISMESRDWYVSTSGAGEYSISSDNISFIGDFIFAYLSMGEYYDAFSSFVDLCEHFITAAGYSSDISDGSGTVTDNTEDFFEYGTDDDTVSDKVEGLFDKFFGNASDGEREPLSLIAIPICLAIGLVVALIVVAVMRSKLKSVRRQAGANNYVKENSMVLTAEGDRYLYRHVDRVAKPKDDDDDFHGGSRSSGGFHTSSSGRSHGGGGGKF